MPVALEPIWLRRYGELEEAIEVNPAFAFAASRLCRAPYGILHRRKLDTALRKEGLASVEPADGLGESRFKGASVEDLVKQNLLGVRPPSKWASDVPPEAFPEECNEVVTAYSAVDMYCLKKLGKKGLLPEVSCRLKKLTATPESSMATSPACSCVFDKDPFSVLLVEAGAC